MYRHTHFSSTRRLAANLLIFGVLLCPVLRAEAIDLQSGETIGGIKFHTDGRLLAETGQNGTDQTEQLVSLLKGLVGRESLSKSAPFLIENRKWVLGVSAAVIVIGLAFCFFGWKFFKFATILGGILSGGVLGLALGGLIAAIIAQALPGEFAQWGGFVLFLLIGIPAAIYGARFGRRFAMFGARMQTLRGLDSGWMDALFALARYAFFDLSVIWGHALFGAILIIPGLYCAVVSLFALPDEHLRLALLASVVVGCSLCVYGAVSQINSLRSEPKSEFPGDY